MNISWNQLAKTANQLAKQAQKRIDTVLDIKDEVNEAVDGAGSSGQVRERETSGWLADWKDPGNSDGVDDGRRPAVAEFEHRQRRGE